MKKLFEKYRELIVYILVGLMATVISYGVRLIVLYAGAAVMSIDLNSADTAVVAKASVLRFVAQTLGSVAAVLGSFYPNKLWVFRNTDNEKKSVLNQFLKFVGSRTIAYFLELGFAVGLPLLLQALGYKAFKFIINVDSDKMSMLISIVVITVFNYVMSKLIVFRKKKSNS